MTLSFQVGEGLYLVGEHRISVVMITPTEEEFIRFNTDQNAGVRK
jgi:hypothetical protein